MQVSSCTHRSYVILRVGAVGRRAGGARGSAGGGAAVHDGGDKAGFSSISARLRLSFQVCA